VSRPDPTRRKSTTRFAVELTLALAVICVAVYLVLIRDLERTLKYSLDRLHAAGAPMTFAQAAGPAVADEDNAVPVYQQAFERLQSFGRFVSAGGTRGHLVDPDGDILRSFLRDNPPGSQQKLRARTSEILARNKAALALVGQAVAKPAFRYPLDAEVPGPAGADVPHLDRFRACARLLAAHAIILSELGITREAIDSCRTGFRMGVQLASQPDMMSISASIGVDSIMLDALRQVVEKGDIEIETCRALYEEVGKPDLRVSFRRAQAAEVPQALWWFAEVERDPEGMQESLARNSPWSDLAAKAYVRQLGRIVRLSEEIRYADFLRRSVTLAAMPYREAKAAYRKLREEMRRGTPSYHLITRTVYEFYLEDNVSASCDVAAARQRAMQVALALKAYHARYHAYPDSLAALRGYPGWKLPQDPFSGKPFAYRRKGAGFVLYSWGEDLDDDGGRPVNPLSSSRDGDIVWEFKR